MSDLKPTPNVILEPHELESIALYLKTRQIDYYLVFELIYKTGYTGQKIIRMNTKTLRSFCEKYNVYIPSNLLYEINMHIKDKEPTDWAFTGIRTGECLSKRSFENALELAGNHFGYEKFGVKTLARTFLYEQFRNSGYDFNYIYSILRSRNRYIGDIEHFIAYCGLTPEQFEEDYTKWNNKSVVLTSSDLSGIITKLNHLHESIQNENYNHSDIQKLQIVVDQIKAVFINSDL